MSANLLGEASDVLDDAVDLEVALEGVAQLTVPAVADFCAIDVLSPDGVLTRVAVPRERGVSWARSVDRWFPSDPEGEHPIANVLRGGRPELVADVRTTRDVMANRRHAGEPTPCSYLVVPLVARGKRLGVLSLVSWIPGRRYRIDDLVLASTLLGRRVLVIEDDRDTREFLRLSLERQGAVVRVAGSGAEALWLLDRGPIDVVLSDLTLPEGDGYSVIRAIRARGLTRLPAIALSALSGPAERSRSAAAGFTEHLAKPIDPDHLARCLARVVRETESA